MSKLTDSTKFKGSLVHAWTEPCQREVEILDAQGNVTGSENSEERFKFIIDENNVPLATVTEKYTLVTNRELVSAVDMAADELGLKVEAERGKYNNGRSYYKLVLPNLSMTVPGDSSTTKATLDIQNDYRGGGSLKLLAGWFRMVCENGLVVGEIASRDIKRHTGDIDLMEFVKPALRKVSDRFEVERLIALELQRRTQSTGLVDAIIADTADRYEADIQEAVRTNTREMGPNLWALSQAISEISTHRMQTRANGEARTGFNAAADTWATRQYNRIREFAGV